MGCWCSSPIPPQQESQESPFTCSAGLAAAAQTSSGLVDSPAKCPPFSHILDHNRLPTLRSSHGAFNPNPYFGSSCSDARESSALAVGSQSARNSVHLSRPLAGCTGPIAPATSGTRPLRDAEFEDHAPPEDEEALDGSGGELIGVGVDTPAADQRREVAWGRNTGTGAAVPGGAADNDRGGGDNIHFGSDSSSDNGLLKSSQHLLHSVVPLLRQSSTAGGASHAPSLLPAPPGGATPLSLPAAAAPPLRLPRSVAAESVADHHQQHPGGGGLPESSQQHTPTTTTAAAANRRSTLTRGFTRDSFLLNNNTAGGCTTAASGYMLRTTGRGDLIDVEACWTPFQMGNPLQVKMGELLGRGGCGSVYRAHWRGRPVAVKVVQQVVAPPAGAAAAIAAAAAAGGGGPGGAAVHDATLAVMPPLIDYFDSSSGAGPHDGTTTNTTNNNKRLNFTGFGGGGVAGTAAGTRAPYLPDAHASVNRLRHPNVLRTYAYAVLSTAPQLGGVLPARHEHHVVLELCEGGSLREWLDKLYRNGAGGGGAGGGVGEAAALLKGAGTAGDAVGGGAEGGADAAAVAAVAAAREVGAAGRDAVRCPPPPPGAGGSVAMAAAQVAARSALERAAAHLNAGRVGSSLAAGLAGGGGAAAVAAAASGSDSARHGMAQMDELQQQQQQLHPGQQQSPQQQQQQATVGLPDPTATDASGITAVTPAGTGAGGAAEAGRGSDRPPPAVAVAAAVRKGLLDGGGAAAPECARSSSATPTSPAAAVNRRLPGLTVVQSEQLQLLGMGWVSDGRCRLDGLASVGSEGRLGVGAGDGAWMTDGNEPDGVAVSSMSEPSTGTDHMGRQMDFGASAGSRRRGSCGSVGGAAAAAAPPSPSARFSHAGGRAGKWADATLARAHGSVGSGAESTRVRPGSSGGGGGSHAVQQHCVVLDEYLDDEDDDGGGGAADGDADGVDMYGGSAGAYSGANAALFGDLRLHARLGLVVEASGEGRQSSRSRCASVAATSTAATTTTTFARNPTQLSAMSSSGAAGGGGTAGGIGTASAASTGTYTPPLAAAATTAATPSLLRGGAAPSGLRPVAAEPAAAAEGRCTALAAGPAARLVSSAPPNGSSGGAAAGAAALEESRRLQPSHGPSWRDPPLQPGFQPPWGAQSPPQPTQPPTPPGESDPSAATALLNRRAVGMVKSILRAAAGAAGSVGAGSGAAAVAAAVAAPMQPLQLRHLVTALGCLLEIASGLSYLHSVGMVHGDVKSGNVLMKVDPRHPGGFVLKLADFGFSRVLEHGSHTYLSRPRGTLAYLSPEMVSSYCLSTAADQYAFGLMVWEVVTTQPLFRGLQTPQLLYAKTHNAEWQHLQWPVWCPQEVRVLAARCTQYLPAARSTAAEARLQLERMRAHYQGVLSRSPECAAEAAPASATTMRMRMSATAVGGVGGTAAPAAAPTAAGGAAATTGSVRC